jgi:hypothetical protein
MQLATYWMQLVWQALMEDNIKARIILFSGRRLRVVVLPVSGVAWFLGARREYSQFSINIGIFITVKQKTFLIILSVNKL